MDLNKLEMENAAKEAAKERAFERELTIELVKKDRSNSTDNKTKNKASIINYQDSLVTLCHVLFLQCTNRLLNKTRIPGP